MTQTWIRVLAAAGIVCGLLSAQSVSVSDKPVRVKGSNQQTKLIKQVRPKYPAEAKAAGVQGLVRLEVVIGKDGTVKETKVLSGPEQLVPPALEAIKQWQWEPTTVDGKPVEVITQIDVNYKLPKSKGKSEK